MTVQSLTFQFAGDESLVAPTHLGLLAVPDLLAHVEAWCAEVASRQLVVDLSQVEVIEAPAFRALLWARRYCASRGRSFVVMPPPDGVLRPLEKAILQDLYPVVDR